MSSERELIVGSLIALVVSTSLIIGGVVWALKGGGKPVRWLPRAPSYALTCVFSALWNAFVVRSFPATVFCLALAGIFKIGSGWSYRRQTWMTTAIVGGLAAMIEVLVIARS